MKDYSFCAFGDIKDRILHCAAEKRIPENAETVIMFLFPYKVVNRPPENISRYAAVPDYHKVCGEKLKNASEKLKNAFPENRFEYFTDNSPIDEVYAASVAGLGLKGDNGLLITRKYGTYAFLGSVITDLKLPCYSEYAECIHCGKCRAACPVKLCKKDCLSAVSQKKGELSEWQKNLLRENGIIWGCDICADACPFNKYAQYTYIKEFDEGYREKYSFGEDSFDRPYNWRGPEVIKRNYKNLFF